MIKPNLCFSRQNVYLGPWKVFLLLGTELWKWLYQNFSESSLIINWTGPHILCISAKKVAKGVGIILKARKLFDQKTYLTLYYTFVHPYLNYCIYVWGKAYNVHIHDLSVLQNKAVRIVNGVPPRTNAQKLCFDSNILTLKRPYNYNISIFMYRFSKNMLPELFEIFFQ